MYQFDAERIRDNMVNQIRQLAKKQGFTKVVIGISGGKDSTVTAALCVRALGKENVYGVMLPDGNQADIEDSIHVCSLLGIPNMTVNISPICAKLREKLADGFVDASDAFFSLPYMDDAHINYPPRIRMTVLRFLTQSLGARLAGTGNLSEITVGYCTKDGDTSCDFSVLGDLTSIEVVQIGLAMGELPRNLVLKTPADGLSGMSDEEKLGVSYESIHHYIRGDQPIDDEIWQKINSKEQKNLHKRTRSLVISRYGKEPYWS